MQTIYLTQEESLVLPRVLNTSFVLIFWSQFFTFSLEVSSERGKVLVGRKRKKGKNDMELE